MLMEKVGSEKREGFKVHDNFPVSLRRLEYNVEEI